MEYLNILQVSIDQFLLLDLSETLQAGIVATVNHAQGIKTAINGELLGEKSASPYQNNP
jgi:hypothetical protein